MIFSEPLLTKVLAQEKTVTRRPVKFETVDTGVAIERPCRYKRYASYAIQPVIEHGPGKGRGGKEVARPFVVRVDRELLGGGLDWSTSEAQREGFGDWPTYREYWIALYGSYNPSQLVDRIEFELLPSPVGEAA